jgi:ankyrin repeat protein
MKAGSEVRHSISEEPAFDWARAGNYYSLSEFFKDGGSVNHKNHDGHSLLMLAACHNRWGLCAWLVKNGADVNSIDLSGNTVLMGACLKGHTRIVKLLLHAGADPFLQNGQGMMAIDFARAFEHEDLVQLLSGGRQLH